MLLIIASYACLHLLLALMIALLLKRRGTGVPVWQLLAINAYAALQAQGSFAVSGYAADAPYLLRMLYHIPLNVSQGLMSYMGLAVFFASAALGFFTSLGFWLAGSDLVPSIYWLVFGATLFFSITVVMGIFKKGEVHKLRRSWLIRIANLHAVFTATNAGEVLGLLVLAALTIPVQALALSLLFNAFGVPLPDLYLAYLAIFAGFSLMISVLPGNFGIRELLMCLLVAHLGISPLVVISLMLVDRVLQLLVLSVLSSGGYLLLKNRSSGQRIAI